jgi:hypothetical protein
LGKKETVRVNFSPPQCNQPNFDAVRYINVRLLPPSCVLRRTYEAAKAGRFVEGNVWHVKCYFGVNEAAMRHHLVILAGLALSATIGKPTVAVAQESKQPPKKRSDGKTQQAALIGCVDQQDGQYVLIKEMDRSVIAQLEAEGFPTEGFAKHLGHKVTVRGTSSSTGGEQRPVFRVRSVEAISDACGPEH